MKQLVEEFHWQLTCLLKFSDPEGKEVTRIDKKGKEITKTESDRVQFIDSARSMISSYEILLILLKEFNKLKMWNLQS